MKLYSILSIMMSMFMLNSLAASDAVVHDADADTRAVVMLML